MRTLEVWLENRLIGHIKENRKGGVFAYTPEIVNHHAGQALLSLSLPVKRRAFGESKTQNWFSGLLPEGKRRQDICQSLGVSEYDWVGLLAQIGWECAGAVKIFEEGEADKTSASYKALTEEELALQLSDASTRMPKQTTETFRMSLGGFQEKLCVAMPSITAKTGFIEAVPEVYLPVGDAPSTHILKPENTIEYPESVESEAWAMTVAGSAARCSHIAVLRIPNAPDTLIVERYDRTGTWPHIARIHQEDACQALGLAPNSKYAHEKEAKGNDPTYQAMAELLKIYALNPREEIAELFRQLIVNMVLGNWDAHAKNTSFLFEAGMVPTLSPLYDVMPITEVEPRTSLLSLRVAGSLNPSSVTRESLIKEAETWGVLKEEAVTILNECLDHLDAGFQQARTLYPQAASRHENPARKRMAMFCI